MGAAGAGCPERRFERQCGELRVEHSNRDDFGNPGGLGPTQVTVGLAMSYLF
jgi:hypothetical protein